jgi:hypothetical protein
MQCSNWDRYSLTSSARASSGGGTVRPSAFAVLRLTIRSYLVGACTDMSAGFDIAGRPPILVDAIGDQTAVDNEDTVEVDRRQFMSGRKSDDQLAMNKRRRARRHDQTAIRGACEGRDCALDFGRVVRVDRPYIYAGRRGYRLNYCKRSPLTYERYPILRSKISCRCLVS